MLDARKFLQQKLEGRQPKALAEGDYTKAAVSLVFKLSKETGAEQSLDLLLMQRAYNDADPWSGQICFPGGRSEKSDITIQATAVRETEEEMGFGLTPNDYIGQLDDVLGPVISHKKSVHVSSFVYLLEAEPLISPNYEVEQVIWAPLNTLLDVNRVVYFDHPSVADTAMHGVRLDALSRDGQSLVLWGLSLYVLEHLMTILDLEI